MHFNKIIALIIGISSLYLISCGEEKQTEESNTESDSKASKILENANSMVKELESAEFLIENKMIDPGTNDKRTDTLHITAKRSGIDDALGLMLKIDLGEGNVVFFNGKQYTALSPKEKKVYIAKEEANPSNFIASNILGKYTEFIISSNDSYNLIKERADELEYIGESEVNGEKADVVKITFLVPEQGYEIVNDLYFSKDSGRLLRMVDTTKVKAQQGEQKTVTIADFKLLEEKENYSDEMFGYNVEENGWEIINIADRNNRQSKGSQYKGESAPAWSLKDASGKVHSLADYKGKVVVLDFWGTWCKWCVKAMPKIQKVHEKFENNENVVVIGISCQEPANADPEQFMKENGITYMTVLNGDNVAAAYNVTGFPTLFILDKEGKFVFDQSGYSDSMDQQMIDIINQNL